MSPGSSSAGHLRKGREECRSVSKSSPSGGSRGGGGKDKQLGNGGGGNISEGGEMVRTNKAIGRGLPNSRGVRAGERDRSLLLLYVVRPSKLGWVR